MERSKNVDVVYSLLWLAVRGVHISDRTIGFALEEDFSLLADRHPMMIACDLIDACREVESIFLDNRK